MRLSTPESFFTQDKESRAVPSAFSRKSLVGSFAFRERSAQRNSVSFISLFGFDSSGFDSFGFVSSGLVPSAAFCG